MLNQIGRRPGAHWINHHVNAFPARQLHRGHEIGVGCDQNDLIDLLLVSQRSHIHAKAHVYALLHDIEFKIIVRRNEASCLS